MTSVTATSLRLLDGQVKLELLRQLLLRVETVGEVDSANTAVGVDLHTQGLNVVGAVGATREVRQVKLDLVPTLVKAHGHGANEGLHASSRLIVGRAEATANILVVEHLHLKGEVLLEVLDDHDEEGELDPEGLLLVGRAGNPGGGHVGRHDLEDGGLDVLVCDALDVAIAHVGVPNLEGLGPDGVKDGQEARLLGVLEHDLGRELQGGV